MKTLIMSAGLALSLVSTGLAGDRWPHYRFVPNGRGGFNYYDMQGYRGWMDQNGYFDKAQAIGIGRHPTVRFRRFRSTKKAQESAPSALGRFYINRYSEGGSGDAKARSQWSS